MRKRMQTFICVLLSAALAFSSFPAAAGETAQEQSVSLVMPVGDMAPRRPSRPLELLSSDQAADLNEKMQQYAGTEESLLINKAASYYYYDRIPPTAKQIYDIFLQVAQDPVSEGNIGLLMTDIDPQSDEFYDLFNLAYRAICFDHPELFWLYSGEEAELTFLSEALQQNGFYYVYIKMYEPFTGFTQQMNAFNSAAQAFLAGIDTSISEYETVRQIHDNLVDLVTYDDATASAISFGWGQDLAHTAYGALVANSDGTANYAVCDGYTLAFEYMCQQCGIDATFVGGMAGPDEASAGGHAWNVVEVDGDWYELDSTWDDLGNLADDEVPGSTMYNYIQEMIADTAFYNLFLRRLFLVSTDRISHFIPGDDLTYVTNDGMYSFFPAGESIHVRIPNDGTDQNFDGRLFQFTPVAEHGYQA